jgi:hypothetical protein
MKASHAFTLIKETPIRQSTGGYILVAVLGTMLLLSGLMAASSVFLRSALHGAHAADADVSMAGLTRSGLEITAYQLFIEKVPSRLVEGRRVRLTGATMIPTVTDEGGKLLVSVFSQAMDAEAAAAVVARVVALRGASRNDPIVASPSPNASTASVSQIKGPTNDAPPRKIQRGFQSVDQLRDLPGIKAADFNALSMMLTVFNPDGKVNIVTASEDVLHAIPGLANATVSEILARRRGADKVETERLQAMLGRAIDFTKIKSGPAYSLRIEVTTEAGVSRQIQAVVAASKSVDVPYYILDWRE